MIACPVRSKAIGQPKYIFSHSIQGGISLIAHGHVIPLIMNSSDYPGAIRATFDLQKDFYRVTGLRPRILHQGDFNRETRELIRNYSSINVSEFRKTPQTAIIIGTIGKSQLIEKLISEHKINASSLRNIPRY